MTSGPLFTTEQIADLRRRHSAGERVKALALAYGASPGYVSRVVSGHIRTEGLTPDEVQALQAAAVLRRGRGRQNLGLTDAVVQQIRDTFCAGEASRNELAARHSVSSTVVAKILTGDCRADCLRPGELHRLREVVAQRKFDNPRKVPRDEYPRILALKQDGHSGHAIARMYGCSHTLIFKILREMLYGDLENS